MRLLYPLAVIAVALSVLGCCPRAHGENLPQVSIVLPQSVVGPACQCPTGAECVCQNGCLCGKDCQCPACPGKADPLSQVANRKARKGNWSQFMDGTGDYARWEDGVYAGRWYARTGMFYRDGSTRGERIESVTGTAVSSATVFNVFGPPPGLFGDCPGGVCRPR